MNYFYQLTNRKTDSEPVPRLILNEQHILRDSDITLLENPYVQPQTVVIRDEGGIFIYTEGIDYLLIPQGPYLEIVRVPGGQIVNNQLIEVDYSINQPGSFVYGAGNSRLRLSYRIKQLLEVYFVHADQSILESEFTEFLVLKHFNQKILGFNANYKMIRIGSEIENYSSNINPYTKNRFYTTIQGNIFKSVKLVMNGDYSHFNYTNSDLIRDYLNLNFTGYKIFRNNIRVSLNAGYRNQTGEQIDLSLFNLSAEIKKTINDLQFMLRLDSYNRIYLGNQQNYQGFRVEISRKF
jgi:hypothetical protein